MSYRKSDLKINMNHGANLCIGKFPHGKTQGIEIKIGHEFFFCDISKDSMSASLEIYPKDPQRHCKYGEGHYSVDVKGDAFLDRKFFEAIPRLSKAQSLLRIYKECVPVNYLENKEV